jgi:2-polyprenyl-6-methoxyphenol hydroxylase-like FAD-dependent oxidoreductase
MTAIVHGRADVVVVGARCAGAATALLLARMGHRVTMVDRASFPSDTLSTHALSRGGMVQLARWGLLDRVMASGTPAIRRIRFFVAGRDVVDRTITPRSGVDHLAAPRRFALDQILVDAAVEAGAVLHTGVAITGVVREGPRITGVAGRHGGADVLLPATVVVGADGYRSRIAEAVRAPFLEEGPAHGAVHYAYYRRSDWDGFEFHIADGVMAGVFPTHGGEANVWACTPAATTSLSPAARAEDFLGLVGSASPELAERVGTAHRTSGVRGAIGLANHIRQAWGPGWALVGDAGLHRDPITGHGITDAFRDAELVARALHEVFTGQRSEDDAGRLYHQLRHELVHELFEATVALSGFPPVEEFVAQQFRANAAMEDEARFLAALPGLSDALAAA